MRRDGNETLANCRLYKDIERDLLIFRFDCRMLVRASERNQRTRCSAGERTGGLTSIGYDAGLSDRTNRAA